MTALMDRTGAWVTRHRRIVLAIWLALLVAAVPFSLRQTDNLTSGGFAAPGSGSDVVERGLEDFERAQGERLAVVLATRQGAELEDVRAALDRVDRAAAAVEAVELAPAVRSRVLAAAGRAPVTVVPLRVTGRGDEVADAAVDLRRELGVGGGPRRGVETYLVGQEALWAGLQDLSKEDLAAAEATGFPIVLLILLAVFGSLAAAGLPIVLGAVSVVISGAGIFFLSQATAMSVFVTNVASMIGIGVAVDYSLFVLARYREEVGAGRTADEARVLAMRTSGQAVVFSGATVMVSLAGLFLVDSTTIRSMAMGAVLVVAVSVLGAVTLLPALIATLGRRVTEPGPLARAQRRLLPARRGRSGAEGFWLRWTRAVMSRPLLTALASAGVLLLLAAPATRLEWGDGALRQFPEGNETRVGAELAARAAGPAAAAPMHVMASFDDGTWEDRTNRTAVGDFVTGLSGDPEIGGVAPPEPSADGRRVLVSAAPRHDGESPQSAALLDRLRADQGLTAPLAAVADVNVGGPTAGTEDFKDLVSGSMWKIFLFVMGFSYLILLVLLRSLLLPLKAVIVNTLSVGAAYGVLVAVFQWGWLDGPLGYESLGYVNTMTPPLVLAIVFGLSMDYEVFLLARIKERYEATGDTTVAVAEGLSASARTITSAALIMVAVFAVFAFTSMPSVQEIGLGLAVAIALDATLVRLVLVPAAMRLMGRWNWWMPAPLARVLPRTDLEGRAAGT